MVSCEFCENKHELVLYPDSKGSVKFVTMIGRDHNTICPTPRSTFYDYVKNNDVIKIMQNLSSKKSLRYVSALKKTHWDQTGWHTHLPEAIMELILLDLISAYSRHCIPLGEEGLCDI